jgi:death on curing protein
VLQIHRTVITSEESQSFELNKLDSAVRATESYAIYGDPEDLFDLAAAYAFYISEGHAFVAGNKRTAVAACLSFLKINGVPTANYNDRELFEWVLDMANKGITREEFAEKLCSSIEEA